MKLGPERGDVKCDAPGAGFYLAPGRRAPCNTVQNRVPKIRCKTEQKLACKF
jgi:hypothetical protein